MPTFAPTAAFKKKFFKDLQFKRYHKDLLIVCDDGTLMANRVVFAAESKYLKSLLKEQPEMEIAEIIFPGIRVKYFERVLKFMYSGKLTVTNEEIHKNYLVWHVKEIIEKILYLDANFDLGFLNLQAPPDDWEDPDPPGSGRSGAGSDESDVRGMGGPSSTHKGDKNASNGEGGSTTFYNDTGGFRQHSDARQESEVNKEPIDRQNEDTEIREDDDNLDILEEEEDEIPDAAENREEGDENDRLSSCSDIMEVDAPRAPTPDIVDLLDSDDDDEATNNTENVSVVLNNAEDDTEQIVSHSMLHQRNDDQINLNTNMEPNLSSTSKEENDLGNGVKKIALPSVARKRSGAGKRIVAKPASNMLSLAEGEIKKETPVAEVFPYMRDGQAAVTRPTIFPGMVVVRGKIVPEHEVKESKPKPTAYIEGVRKYNPNSITITGLRRVESLIAVKEEKGVHACDHCTARYENYKSLEVHIQRSHKEKKAECPECGKKLSHHGAIKKHLLTHRPESEWPYECPICHKRFQARADIPKHLLSNVHKNDAIPKHGSEEWYRLLYPEKHREDLAELQVKVSKQRKAEIDKIANLPAEAGVTLEEYEEWNQINMPGTSKRKADELDPSFSSSVRQSDNEVNGRRTKRMAAANARQLLCGIREDGAL